MAIADLQAAEIQNYLIVVTLVVTTILSLWLHFTNRAENGKNRMNDKLLFLQRVSFDNEFVEDKHFTETWLTLKDKYLKGKADEEETKRCLQYDSYCEMLFNFVSEAHHYYKTENKLLQFVAFKQWVRNHRSWWEHPLEEHSNHDTYDSELSHMIDDWMK